MDDPNIDGYETYCIGKMDAYCKDLEAKNGELERKLIQSQAVYDSLIDGAARDTEKINKLTEQVGYIKHLHSTSWDHQQAEIKELSAKNEELEGKLKVAVMALEFYGNIENYRNPTHPKGSTYNQLESEDGSDLGQFSRGKHLIAGNRARQALEKIKAIKERG